MNKENASKLWKIIQEAGDYPKGMYPRSLLFDRDKSRC